MIDLEEIRRRNDAQKSREATYCNAHGGKFDYEFDCVADSIDALLTESGRLPRAEVSRSNLTVVCAICRRSVPVDGETRSVVNAPVDCVRPDCSEVTDD